MGACYNSAVINAPIDQVWSGIKDFHNLDWAAGVVEKCDKVGDKSGDQLGAQRILNDAFHETLLSIDDLDHSFSYSIDDGPGPVAADAVSNFIAYVRLFTITENNTTFIEWRAKYESADNAAVGELCNPIYQALLSAMQKHFA